MINKFAYFAIGSDIDAAGDAVMVPVDSFVGAEISLDDALLLNFKDVGASFATAPALAIPSTRSSISLSLPKNIDAPSVFTLVHDVGASQQAIEQVAAAFASNPKDGFISMVDVDNDDIADSGIDVITDVTYSL